MDAITSDIFYRLRQMGFNENSSIPWQALKSAMEFMSYGIRLVDAKNNLTMFLNKLHLQDGDVLFIKANNTESIKGIVRDAALEFSTNILVILGDESVSLEKVPFETLLDFIKEKHNREVGCIFKDYHLDEKGNFEKSKKA